MSQIKVKQIDFKAEALRKVGEEPWKDCDLMFMLIQWANILFTKTMVEFTNLLNNLMVDDPDLDFVYSTVYDLPQIANSNDKDLKLFCILLQNQFHLKNSARVEAISNGSYSEFKTLKECKQYLAKLLLNLMMDRLNQKFTKMSYRISTKSEAIYAEQILRAPNVFYAAEIMSAMYFRFGNGDFSAVLNLIATKKDSGFHDLASKLALVKYGILYPSNVKPFANEFV